MTGLHPSVPVDPLWVNVTTSSPWCIPVEWWQVVYLLVGIAIGVWLASMIFPWGQSP